MFVFVCCLFLIIIKIVLIASVRVLSTEGMKDTTEEFSSMLPAMPINGIKLCQFMLSFILEFFLLNYTCTHTHTFTQFKL